jgi:hypothetical protein
VKDEESEVRIKSNAESALASARTVIKAQTLSKLHTHTLRLIYTTRISFPAILCTLITSNIRPRCMLVNPYQLIWPRTRPRPATPHFHYAEVSTTHFYDSFPHGAARRVAFAGALLLHRKPLISLIPTVAFTPRHTFAWQSKATNFAFRFYTSLLLSYLYIYSQFVSFHCRN